jgi:hypothetical protein
MENLIFVGAIFLVVGVVVSLDVAGLTLCKSKSFAEDSSASTLRLWAITNAGWHSLLLLVYILVIKGVFDFSFLYIEFLAAWIVWVSEVFQGLGIGEYAERLAEMLAEHSRIILGIFTLSVIWKIYSDKIAGEPEAGNRGSLGILAQLLYDFIEICLYALPGMRTNPARVGRIMRWQSQAALVAIDMLALAALMNSMSYLDSTENVAGLIVVVLIFVFAITILAGRVGIRLIRPILPNTENRESPDLLIYIWSAITLRLVEPFIIFYFALELIAFLLFGQRIHSVGFVFGAGLLLTGLVLHVGFGKIANASTKRSNTLIESEDHRRSPRAIGFDALRTLVRPVKWLLLGTLGFVFVTIAMRFFHLQDGPEGMISLDTEISRIFMLLSIISLVLHVISARARAIIGRACATIIRYRYSYLFICGALIVASIFPLWETMAAFALEDQIAGTIGGPCGVLDLGVTVNHIHSFQVIVFLIGLFIASVAINRLETEHQISRYLMIRPENRIFEFSQVVWLILVVLSLMFFGISFFQEALRLHFAPCY